MISRSPLQHGACFRRPEADRSDAGAHDHAAGERVVEGVELLQRRRQRRPVIGQKVVGFGIELRICQMLVIVVGEMQLAIAPIGEPQARIDRNQQLVEQPVAGRMAMQSFMLQGTMERDEIGADGNSDPPGQPGEEPHQQSEQNIRRDDERHCRPLNMEWLCSLDLAGR